MRLMVILSLPLAMLHAAAQEEFSLVEPADILRRPPPAPESDGLISATVEPTKYERRYADVFAAEKWEQGFLLTARLPLTEALSLRQEVRTGLQAENILGDEFSATYRDALSMLEKTAAELKASEALRVAAFAQQQWLATNRVPFSEIVTYGGEAKYSPRRGTTVRLQLDLAEQNASRSAASTQDSYRLQLEQDLVPRFLSATGGVGWSEAEDAVGERAAQQRYEASLKWTPAPATALTLGGERGLREGAAAVEQRDALAVRWLQQLHPRSRFELQAGYEQQTRTLLGEPLALGSGWNLGANSDFELRPDWRAGVGLRYRDEKVDPRPGEVSVTLSVKGQF